MIEPQDLVLLSENKDLIFEEVETRCKEVALDAIQLIIDLAMGKIEMSRDQRQACLDVLKIAKGEKFRGKGRPAGTEYQQLRISLQANDNEREAI